VLKESAHVQAEGGIKLGAPHLRPLAARREPRGRSPTGSRTPRAQP
jgi:hypothetical protein